MAYTVPDLNDYLPGEPWTSAKALLVVENPTAIANGDEGAPRVSPAAWGHTALSGSAIGTVLLSDFSAYGGAHIEIKFSNNVVGATSMTLELSADGSTFGTPFTIASVSGNSDGNVSLFVDFTSGDVRSVWQGTGGAGLNSGTTGTFVSDISHVRLVAAGISTTTIAALAFPNAGTVA